MEQRNNDIIAEPEELKTSQEWYKLIPKEFEFLIYDPDGWDRQNYEYSFNEEKITKQEFMIRIQKSTCLTKTQLTLFNW